MKRVTVFIILFVFGTLVFAEDMPRVTVPDAASNGFGGPHTAYTDNIFSLLVNPAAMIQVQQGSFFTLAPSVMNPQSTFDLIGAFIGGDVNIEGALDVMSKQKGKIALGVELRAFPLSVAWVANGFGFAVMNNTFVNLNLKGTYMEANAYEDLMFPFGLAFKIFQTKSHTVDAGVTLKPFFRLLGKETMDIVELAGGADIFGDLSLPIIAGASFDIGFLYRWDAGFQAGLTFNDVYGRGSAMGEIQGKAADGSYRIPFSMNWGVSYDFRPERFWPELPNIVKALGVTFAFDWRDFTGVFFQDDYSRRNASLDIGLGLQFSLYDMIFLRFGMNEMLPAVGLGFDFGSFKIDLAYYGKELGNEPGLLPAAVLEFSFSIRPELKPREWSWAQKSILGSFGIGE